MGEGEGRGGRGEEWEKGGEGRGGEGGGVREGRDRETRGRVGRISWFLSHTHTHPNPAPVSTPTGEGGECFLVERCESDVEGEGGGGAGVEAEQLLLTLSDRFLEEKSYATGEVGWSCDYHVID